MRGPIAGNAGGATPSSAIHSAVLRTRSMPLCAPVSSEPLAKRQGPRPNRRKHIPRLKDRCEQPGRRRCDERPLARHQTRVDAEFAARTDVQAEAR